MYMFIFVSSVKVPTNAPMYTCTHKQWHIHTHTITHAHTLMQNLCIQIKYSYKFSHTYFHDHYIYKHGCYGNDVTMSPC